MKAPSTTPMPPTKCPRCSCTMAYQDTTGNWGCMNAACRVFVRHDGRVFTPECCPACARAVPDEAGTKEWVLWFLNYARDTHAQWAASAVCNVQTTGDQAHNQRAVEDYQRVIEYVERLGPLSTSVPMGAVQ